MGQDRRTIATEPPRSARPAIVPPSCPWLVEA